MDTISVSQALQIAGRAGRYGTQYEKVINFSKHMLSTNNKITCKLPLALYYIISFPMAQLG